MTPAEQIEQLRHALRPFALVAQGQTVIDAHRKFKSVCISCSDEDGGFAEFIDPDCFTEAAKALITTEPRS